MKEQNAWAYNLLNENSKKLLQSGDITFSHNILKCNIESNDAREFYENNSGGAFLRKLKDIKYSQAYWESPYYFKLLDKYLSDIDLSDKTVMDFGCGDGRFTEYLLNKGAKRIICVDFDYRTLHELSTFIESTGNSDKVLLIQSDLANLPLLESSIDILLAIRVLYYFNDLYERAIAQFYNLLGNSGLLIISDPDLESFVLTNLVFEDLSSALEVFEKRRFNEVNVQNNLKFRVFTENELNKIYVKNNFQVLDKHGITMIHKILRILQLRNKISFQDIEKHEDRIKKLFDFLDREGKFHKDLVWKLKKMPVNK
jgi:SAM-dependent methyltransferase